MTFHRPLTSFLSRALPAAIAALLLPALVFSLAACTSSGTYPGGFGATPGGVQDMGLARELIAAGIIPPASAFVVEGMFSEHDLPLGGGPCGRTLCIRGAGAVAPDAEGAPAGWVQLGLSSSIDPATFVRDPVSLVMVIDVSGSMAWGGGDDTPGEISRSLLHALVEQLGEGDEIALVTYGSSVAVPSTLAAPDAASLHRTIDGLSENGSTNLEAGLTQGIAIARAIRTRDTDRAVRVMLFTDEQPNVGATSPESFGGMVSNAAAADIGITVFGAGRGLGQEVFLAMSHLRGGNGFSLFRQDDVTQVIEESWPWMLVPVAFDMHVDVTRSEGLEVTRGHGFPDAEAGASPSLDASTVFLSQRRGALLLEVAGTEVALAGGTIALDLSYTEPNGELVEEHLQVALPVPAEGAIEAYAQPALRSTVALALLVTQMRAAVEAYSDRPADATELLRAARDRFESDAAATGDTSLAAELTLADDLLVLMESGAASR